MMMMIMVMTMMMMMMMMMKIAVIRVAALVLLCHLNSKFGDRGPEPCLQLFALLFRRISVGAENVEDSCPDSTLC